MNKRIVAIVVIVGVLIVGAATAWMVLQPSNQASAPQSGGSSNQESTPAGKEVTITYTDSGFDPKELTAKKGDTLRVLNESAGDLEFSSDSHPTHRDNPELNMDTLQPGESGILALTKAGEWGYHNHLRDEDTGKLMVTE